MFFCYRQSVDFRTSSGRGYRIGHAWSDDLHNWTRDDDNPQLAAPEGEWDSDMQCYPHAFECDGNVYLLYNGNQFGRQGFGLAKLSCSDDELACSENQATEQQIAQHLQDCDASFVPRLSSRVDLPEYAHKISLHAQRFEAWSGTTLVGLVATYCNNAEQPTAFITSVSILPLWTRQGIAHQLMRHCIDYLKSLNLDSVSLEVAADNGPALAMYAGLGFHTDTANQSVVKMTFKLK